MGGNDGVTRDPARLTGRGPQPVDRLRDDDLIHLRDQRTDSLIDRSENRRRREELVKVWIEADDDFLCQEVVYVTPRSTELGDETAGIRLRLLAKADADEGEQRRPALGPLDQLDRRRPRRAGAGRRRGTGDPSRARRSTGARRRARHAAASPEPAEREPRRRSRRDHDREARARCGRAAPARSGRSRRCRRRRGSRRRSASGPAVRCAPKSAYSRTIDASRSAGVGPPGPRRRSRASVSGAKSGSSSRPPPRGGGRT